MTALACFASPLPVLVPICVVCVASWKAAARWCCASPLPVLVPIRVVCVASWKAAARWCCASPLPVLVPIRVVCVASWKAAARWCCASPCVASDFARRDPGSFRPHLRWLLALIMEAVNDDIDTAEAGADADSRAEVRLVAADADGADLPGRRGSRGWGGPVGDHPAASSCPRWSDRGAAGVEAGPAASVSPGGVGGRGVTGRGRPASGDGGRAGRRVGGAAGKSRWG